MASPKTVIITAGGTMEPIDPVRYIGNRSSGKMGMALVEAALHAGLRPVLVYANVSAPFPKGKYRKINTPTASEMLKTVRREFVPGSMLVMAAAVADFKPAKPAKSKIKKSGGGLTLRLVPGPDILKDVSKHKKDRLIAGFSAETDNILSNSLRKMREKKMDLLVINDVGRKDIGFGSDFNEVTLVVPDGRRQFIRKTSKLKAAKAIISKLLEIRRTSMPAGRSPR